MFHRYDTAKLEPAPWKNGGGSTIELARAPQAPGLDDFDWRISIATIAADGPFSTFPGIDRTIVLLSGAGVHLRSADGEIDHALVERGKPFSFPGDVPIDAHLRGGVSRDFNVMLRRPLRAEVLVLRDAAAVAMGDCGLLYADAGEWSMERGPPLRPGEMLQWTAENASLRMHPRGADALLIAVHIIR